MSLRGLPNRGSASSVPGGHYPFLGGANGTRILALTSQATHLPRNAKKKRHRPVPVCAGISEAEILTARCLGSARKNSCRRVREPRARRSRRAPRSRRLLRLMRPTFGGEKTQTQTPLGGLGKSFQKSTAEKADDACATLFFADLWIGRIPHALTTPSKPFQDLPVDRGYEPRLHFRNSLRPRE